MPNPTQSFLHFLGSRARPPAAPNPSPGPNPNPAPSAENPMGSFPYGPPAPNFGDWQEPTALPNAFAALFGHGGRMGNPFLTPEPGPAPTIPGVGWLTGGNAPYPSHAAPASNPFRSFAGLRRPRSL